LFILCNVFAVDCFKSQKHELKIIYFYSFSEAGFSYVDQVGLKPLGTSVLPTTTTQALGLQVHAPMPS
jgi:hypothetical protein